MAPYYHFLSTPWALMMYKKAGKLTSLERSVDQLWLNILRQYLKFEDGFMLAAERYPTTGRRTRMDLGVTTLKNKNQEVLLICVENKRHGLWRSGKEWEKALEQLESYVATVRRQKGKVHKETVYGIVNIGTRTRFYQIPTGSARAEDLDIATQDVPYMLGKNEKEIHDILEQLRTRLEA